MPPGKNYFCRPPLLTHTAIPLFCRYLTSAPILRAWAPQLYQAERYPSNPTWSEVIWQDTRPSQETVGYLCHESRRLQLLGFKCLYVIGIGIRTQQNNRMVLPIVAAEVDRILFQVEKIEDFAKNIVDLPVVWIWSVQNFFYVNNISLNVRLPHVRNTLERTSRITVCTMDWCVWCLTCTGKALLIWFSDHTLPNRRDTTPWHPPYPMPWAMSSSPSTSRHTKISGWLPIYICREYCHAYLPDSKYLLDQSSTRHPTRNATQASNFT